MSFVVFESILDHRNYYDHSQRKSHDWLTIGNSDHVDRLHVSNDQEVDVRCLLQLVEEEVLGHEVEWGIL